MKSVCRYCLVPLAVLCLFAASGCGLLRGPRSNITPTTAASTVAPDETSAPAADSQTDGSETATETEGVPRVITYFELNDTYPLDEMFDAGFMVSLPKIESDKPGAVTINNEVDKLRVALETERAAAAPLSEYDRRFEYTYTTAVFKDIVFITLNTYYGLWASEYMLHNSYYAYDYKTDTTLNNPEIAGLFGRDMAWVLTEVNKALATRDTEPLTGPDKIALFVNKDLKLAADAKIESEMGGDYSEILVLT